MNPLLIFISYDVQVWARVYSILLLSYIHVAHLESTLKLIAPIQQFDPSTLPNYVIVPAEKCQQKMLVHCQSSERDSSHRDTLHTCTNTQEENNSSPFSKLLYMIKYIRYSSFFLSMTVNSGIYINSEISFLIV